jgi:hypothetical protein
VSASTSASTCRLCSPCNTIELCHNLLHHNALTDLRFDSCPEDLLCLFPCLLPILLTPVWPPAGSSCAVIPVLHDCGLCALLAAAVITADSDTLRVEEAACSTSGCGQDADSCVTMLPSVANLKILSFLIPC